MKASEVKRILRVTQATINSYIKKGKLHPKKINNYHYEYDENEVYSLIGKGKFNKKVVTYSRVSTQKQKNDLKVQKERIKQWAESNGYKVDVELTDIKSGMEFKNRTGFSKLIRMAADREIDTLIIENRDRLSRFGFELIEHMMNTLGTSVIVISNVGSKDEEKELADDLLSIIHYYTQKSYALRRALNISKNAIEEDMKKYDFN